MPRRWQALITVSLILWVAGAGGLAQQPEGHYAPAAGVAVAGAPSAPTLQTTSGGTLVVTSYYVKVSYTSRGGETAASPESMLRVGAGSLLVVVSPAGATDATGWNVYASTSSGTETRQNGPKPLALGTIWIEPASGLVKVGRAPMGDGLRVPGVQPASPGASEVFRSAGNVGIGTTAPQNELHIEGAFGTTTEGLRIHNTTAGAVGNISGIAFSAANSYITYGDIAYIRGVQESAGVSLSGQLEFGTGSSRYPASTQMTLTSAGNLGIGTTTPALQLQLGPHGSMAAGITSAAGTTWTIDVSTGNTQQFACTGNGTPVSPSVLTSSFVKGEIVTLVFVQTASPNRACTLNWTSSHVWGAMTSAQVSTLGSVNAQQFVVSNNGTDLYAASPVQSNTGGNP